MPILLWRLQYPGLRHVDFNVNNTNTCTNNNTNDDVNTRNNYDDDDNDDDDVDCYNSYITDNISILF